MLKIGLRHILGLKWSFKGVPELHIDCVRINQICRDNVSGEIFGDMLILVFYYIIGEFDNVDSCYCMKSLLKKYLIAVYCCCVFYTYTVSPVALVCQRQML